MANSTVSLTGGNGLPYDAQLAQIKRQQQMADALQQQMAQPIDVQQGGGAPAAISWGSVLAKALQGVSGQMRENYAQSATKQLGEQDNASVQALLKGLQGPEVAQVGTQNIAPQAAQLSVPNPMGGAPAQAQMQMPGAQGTGMQMARQAPTSQEALAMLLGADGGPKTDRIAAAMVPQIMNRDNTQWERGLGMTQAAKEQLVAQEGMSQRDAEFKNKLGETPHELAQDQIERDKQRETASYHNAMTGMGLTEDGAPNPTVQSWVGQIAAGNATPQNVPGAGLKNAVIRALNAAPKAIFSPLAARRWGLASNAIVSNLMKLPQYELTAHGLPFVQRIAAAMETKGSVSDQDLLDSFTKLNTAGNAITDAQVRIITDGKSLSDWAGVNLNKLKNGGVLSDSQRQDIKTIANKVYDNYSKGYQPVYDQAAKQLTDAGVPKAFWTIPDLNTLSAGLSTITKDDVKAGGGGPQIAPAGTVAKGPNGEIKTSDGKGGWK